MLTATEFNEMADALFEQIVETIDVADAAEDVELNQGVLEVSCADGSKIIINRHGPNQEIWVAARSGGHHFKWADGAWVDTRSGEMLSDAISRVVREQTGAHISFD